MTSNFKFQISNFKRGFTLIELIVTVSIIAILSGIILFSVSQYISSGKDSNISGNLSVLIAAGEVYYNGNNPDGYSGFCNSSVVINAKSQMPINVLGNCYNDSTNPSGVCCSVNQYNDAWAACAKEFADLSDAYCVDSRGVEKEISNSACTANLTQCP